MSFKKDFVWGVATGAYQIEGAWNEDGKAPSVWDDFCRVPGATYQGDSGEIACDHYHRFKEDIAIMKQMGIKAYRFSISWPRVLPQGIGTINEEGIAFYENLVDELIANGITPYLTLFHWDYPTALYHRGGWLNPESPKWFAEYATLIAKRFAGKVKHYMTINEPQCFIGLGYGSGVHAPGLKLSPKDTFAMVHHVLLAHGYAVKAIRQFGGADVQVGLATCGGIKVPQSDTKADIEAARACMFDVPNNYLAALISISLWCDPIYFGEYPEACHKYFADIMPEIGADDMKIISQPLDFIAHNIYEAIPVQATANGGFQQMNFPAGMAKTGMDWPVIPDSLYWGSKFFYERYKLPILITENGMSALDTVSVDGKVHDPNRVDFLYRYLRALKKSVEDGTDIIGYFQWSLMDNFEWSRGFHDRFGLVYVDYQTQRRTLKDSAYWYKEVIEHNGENLV